MTARQQTGCALATCAMLWFAAGTVCAQSDSDDAYAATPIPEPSVRAAARRILADPAFSGFDHFDSNPKAPQASATPSTPASSDTDAMPGKSSQSTQGQGSSSSQPPRNWWEEVRNNARKSSQTGEAGHGNGSQTSGQSDSYTQGTSETGNGDNSKSSSPNSTGSADGTSRSTTGNAPSSNRGDESRSTETPADSAPSRETTSSTNDEAGTAERPQRTDDSTAVAPQRPSQLGRDGVTRPVRFAPKPPPPPRASSDSNWNFDFGFGRLLGGIGAALGGMFHGLAYFALGLVILLLVGLAARAIVEILRRPRSHLQIPGASGTLLEDDHSPGEIAADVYRQRALEFARQGDYRAAVAQLLLGAMSAIERRQWIRYRRGLTLADYLRSVRSQPATYSGMSTVVRVYEPIEYGRQPATADGFQLALEGYQQGFGTLN